MNILIIGGTGLISAPMTHFFLERGDRVAHYNRGKFDLYPAPPGVTTLHGDRTDYPRFEAQMADAGAFDVVIDMVGYLPGDGESAVRAFRGRVGHFIFCSTVDVYRKPASRYPYTEEEGYGGLNDYSSRKVVIEKTLQQAHADGAFPLTIIRPAYTYGEGRGPLHSFGWSTAYLDRIRKGKPIVVHGDGSSFWAACHCSDVARSFVAAAGNPTAFGQAYHVTGEEWLTWDLYHQQAAAALGAPPPQLVHIPTELLDPLSGGRSRICTENLQFNNIFDNTKAKLDLGFRYTVPWMEGVRRMAAWLDAHGGPLDSDQEPFEDRLIEQWRRLTHFEHLA